jgi:hypothetical protein
MHMVRTTVMLDAESRQAADALSAKLGISSSEVIRRALANFRDQQLGVPASFRRKRSAAFLKLSALMQGGAAEAEVRAIKRERRSL